MTTMEQRRTYRIYIPSIKQIIVTPDIIFMDFTVITGKIPNVNIRTDGLHATPVGNPEKPNTLKEQSQNPGKGRKQYKTIRGT